MTYKWHIYKRTVEDVFIFPFIFLGKIIAFIRPSTRQYETIYFFPFYHTGGAEKVHLQIVQATGNNNCLVIFTRKSKDKTFLKDFVDTSCSIKDISAFTDNKWIFFVNLIYRGYMTACINRQYNVLVFNGQSNFGYKISSWLGKNIQQVDLVHALNTFSYIRIPFIKNYKYSVTVSEEIIDKHRKIYKPMSIPAGLLSNFIFIETKIELPAIFFEKDYNSEKINILYAGRATPEKRVHIAAEVAKKVLQKNPNAEFHFAGDVQNSIPVELHKFCIFHGNISQKNRLDELYDSAHILIVPSSTESGPLVIMEAMARGLAIVTTEVGFVPGYMKNMENGYKIFAGLEEDQLSELMSMYIQGYLCDRKKLEQTGILNRQLAAKYFGIDSFYEAYKTLFINTRINK